MMMVLSPLPEVVKQAEKEKKERMAARKRAKSAESGGAVLLDEDEDEDEDEDDDAVGALEWMRGGTGGKGAVGGREQGETRDGGGERRRERGWVCGRDTEGLMGTRRVAGGERAK
jgi:hypothetical protein